MRAICGPTLVSVREPLAAVVVGSASAPNLPMTAGRAAPSISAKRSV
jgi:hypothetical protein